MKIKVTKRLLAWCKKNYGGQGTLSYAIQSIGRVETNDLRPSNLWALECMAHRLERTVPPYLRTDVRSIISKIAVAASETKEVGL